MAPAEGRAAAELEGVLAAVREKIHPRAVSGVFAALRVGAVLLTQVVYYGLPWWQWNGRQAVLFDLASRKFYVFGLVLWPQDFVYLAALLIISALGLFLFTAVAGRLWCGYACPQTVYTEIFMWIERRIEGNRRQQIKLDESPWKVRKIAVKGAKHGVWIAFSLWTGLTFVGYFTPIETLARGLVIWSFGPWETFWILFYGFATYGNAGWLREQVCTYMCPYARFQSVMFDSDTLVITYDPARGEPRGPRAKRVDRAQAGMGDCVDCSICVQVCPTGIDIRKGLQYMCIGCAACIDGCNQVMDKMGYPRGLIRYSTEGAMEGKYPHNAVPRRLFRPRVLLYSLILCAITVALALALYLRVPLQVDVMRDRWGLARQTEQGGMENVYRMQITNMDDKPHRYTLSATGPATFRVVAAGLPLAVPALSSRSLSLRLRADPRELKGLFTLVTFRLRATDDPALQRSVTSRFLSR